MQVVPSSAAAGSSFSFEFDPGEIFEAFPDGVITGAFFRQVVHFTCGDLPLAGETRTMSGYAIIYATGKVEVSASSSEASGGFSYATFDFVYPVPQ